MGKVLSFGKSVSGRYRMIIEVIVKQEISRLAWSVSLHTIQGKTNKSEVEFQETCSCCPLTLLFELNKKETGQNKGQRRWVSVNV